MQINKRLTKVNYTKGQNRKIKYIVIHYVGATGSAENNCKYFEKVYRGASAHYFVGHAGDVWQCVEDKDISWGVSAVIYKHKECRNANCINIEMCCRKDAKGKWYFEPQTVASTIDLTKELMAKYKIPVGNVIRHYDVTGKTCPEPYVRSINDWNSFKAQLTTTKLEEVKSIDVIAKEVISGKWGNGADRKKRLEAAGYSYSAVQAKVNELLTGKPQTTKPSVTTGTVNKSVETVAKEVIQGKWGNGAARKKKLEAAGYNYSEVQAMVNKLLK